MKRILFCCIFLLGLIIFSGPEPTCSVDMAVVTVTAYHPGVRARDSRPGITASGRRVQEGMVALSRDVEYMLDLEFGDEIRLEGLGVYQFQDRTAYRCRKKADIFLNSYRKARHFGVRRNVLLLKLV
ncbi:MAG: hypothetical protein BZ151_07875 [Desulfobacca sp. 4484_104]|nr:MAG: hypothetical protein BZ151_07875 [Desulfobacca sp. 4484_104]RLA89511.1 MAG: hypothetical protein DRG58_04935 [Deltaproteobacteria bacterium]